MRLRTEAAALYATISTPALFDGPPFLRTPTGCPPCGAGSARVPPSHEFGPGRQLRGAQTASTLYAPRIT